MSKSLSQNQAGARFLARNAGGTSPVRTRSTPRQFHSAPTDRAPDPFIGFEIETCPKTQRVTALRRKEMGVHPAVVAKALNTEPRA